MTERIRRWFRRWRRRLTGQPAITHHRLHLLPPYKGPHDSVTD
jgi:hypothetical protein